MRAVLLSPIYLFSIVFAASTAPRPKIISTTTESASSEEEIDWECGTDAFTKYISENQIDIDCPELKKTVNQCCLTHDACYDEQRGRKFCDDTFCNCLEVATKPSKMCSKEDGPLFCNLVRDFGAEAYRRSGNGTAATEEPLVHEVEPDHKTNSTETSHDYETEVSGHDALLHSLNRTVQHLEAADAYTSH